MVEMMMVEMKRSRTTAEDEAMLMRRKCAKSIYELTARPDKGPLLVDNGVLEALSVLSAVRRMAFGASSSV